MTWNLWWRFGDWRARRDLIRQTLTEVQADVIGLQEVWATPDQHQARTLAEELGMHWTWAPSPTPEMWQGRVEGPRVEHGNAVLSRWPLRTTTTVQLPPGDEHDTSRTALAVEIDTPFGLLPFVTTQLTSAPHASTTRRAQIEVLAATTAALTGPRPDTQPTPTAAGAGNATGSVLGAGGLSGPGRLAPIVTGDFNAEPDSDEVRALCGHKTPPAVPGLVLVDAWRYADPTDPGWTWTLRNPHLTGMGVPNARIDYILVGLPRGRGAGDVAGVGTAGDATSRAPQDWASDHLAVWADIRT